MKPRVPNWKEVTSVPPNEWNRVFLGDVFAHRQERGQINLPLLSVTAKNGVVRQDTLNRRDTSNDDKSRYFRIFPGDIVYNTMRMWQGVSALTNDEGIVSPAYTICTPKDGILSKYAKYLFKFQPLINVFRGYSQGLVNDTLNLKFESFSQIEIILPPIQEQKKIAAILCSVDDGIQATQAVIDQTQRVKQGLMQQLFTRGIGHTRFKQTEIGEVPEEWELIPFNQVLDVRSGKGFRLDEYVYEGIKLLRIDNVSWGEITWDSIAYLPTHYADEYSELLLKEGDILLALNRPITQGKLKLAILKREDSPAILYQRVGKILFKNDNMLNNFVFHLLNYSLPPFIMEKSVGSDQPFINITALRKLKLPIPTLNEQHKIAAILDENDECIGTHNKYLEHLFNLKHGLMQDLLTGRVRVKPDEVNTT